MAFDFNSLLAFGTGRKPTPLPDILSMLNGQTSPAMNSPIAGALSAYPGEGLSNMTGNLPQERTPTKYGMSSMMPMILSQLGGVAAIGANNPAMAAFSQVGQQMAAGTLEDVYMRELRKDPLATPPPMLDRNAARLLRQEVMQTEEFKYKRQKDSLDTIFKLQELGASQKQLDLALLKYERDFLLDEQKLKLGEMELSQGPAKFAQEQEESKSRVEANKSLANYRGLGGSNTLTSYDTASKMVVDQVVPTMPSEVLQEYQSNIMMGLSPLQSATTAYRKFGMEQEAQDIMSVVTGGTTRGQVPQIGPPQVGGAPQTVSPPAGAARQGAPSSLQRMLSPADIAAITPFVSANGLPIRDFAPMQPEQFDARPEALQVAPDGTRFKVNPKFVIIADDPPGAAVPPAAPTATPTAAPTVSKPTPAPTAAPEAASKRPLVMPPPAIVRDRALGLIDALNDSQTASPAVVDAIRRKIRLSEEYARKFIRAIDDKSVPSDDKLIQIFVRSLRERNAVKF